MLQILAAHKPSRLLFAVLTLSIAILGIVTNYALSHDAIRAFQAQLALKDDDQFLLTGQLSDMQAATRNRHDSAAFDARIDRILDQILPVDVEVHVLRIRTSRQITDAGSHPVRLVQARRDFLAGLDAAPLPGPAWDESHGLCLLGGSVARHSGDSGALDLDGRRCPIVGTIDLPELPPFLGLNEAVFIANGIDELATDLAVGWTIHLRAPAGTLSDTALRAHLNPVFDLAYLTIWSGADVVARAERLIAIVRLIANGLGVVILLVGGASIASLMSFSIAERAREIAVKRTIGASRGQILREIMAEAMLIGLISCAIGTVAGSALALHLKAPLAEFLAVGLTEVGRPSVWPVVKAVAQVLILCALAGAIPGWRAATRDPAAVLRAA
ncbi:FtsX-like permease family protein [Paracoccus liaowanqingii]|uniref:FtsX-like permease family protein n=1 Tax=Paracoccus liaowanqingii TaxID=2560053 RepID=A0A4P7HMN3_9RHOB|nr:FtsX-like permease family protein [Paracoccus liaowanqingii]QBX34943.1 FtsX-like permease family protein [Paracoccus liaowanqingii]